MRAWAWALALVVVSFLLAAPLVWSTGGSARPFLPTPVPTTTATPEPPGEGIQEEDGEPPEPSDLAHRPRVLQRSACANCHRLDGGWLLPDDHASFTEQDCQDCHLPVPEPSPVTIHDTPPVR